MKEKQNFPDFITEKLTDFIDLLTTEGKFFENPEEFSDNESIEIGKVNLWNLMGEAYIEKYLKNVDEITFTPEEVEKVLVHVVIQTNLDMLLKDKLIDGIENENGEMVYWLTEKGKEVHKTLE